jgi:hypothetical protein
MRTASKVVALPYNHRMAARRTNEPIEPMNARQRRAVAGRVVLAVPPSDDPERGAVARSRAGAAQRRHRKSATKVTLPLSMNV